MKYGDRIRTLRKNKGYSQEKLADMLGVTKQTVSQYERGVRKPDVHTIEALCDIFNVSSDYLLGMADRTIRLVGEDDLAKLDTSDESGYYYDPETAALAQELYDNKELGLLMSASRKMSPEALRNLTALVESMIKDEKDNGRS